MNRFAPLLTICHFATIINWSASGDGLLIAAGVALAAHLFVHWVSRRARGELELA